jgi:hypothetical protein
MNGGITKENLTVHNYRKKRERNRGRQNEYRKIAHLETGQAKCHKKIQLLV